MKNLKVRSTALTDQPRAREEAAQAGFFPVTDDYTLRETDMLQRAADQLAQGGILHCIVHTNEGRQLWRR